MEFTVNKETAQESVNTQSRLKKKKTIKMWLIIAIMCVAILATSVSIGKTNIYGTWVFSYCENEDGNYRRDTEYDGIWIADYYVTTVCKFNFDKDNIFIAECYEKSNSYVGTRYDEKKIKGEYKIDGNTIILTWGTSDEKSFEFEKRGSTLILTKDSYSYYCYEKE